MMLMRQQELAFWRDSLELLHRNHARLLPPAASGRSIAGSAAFGRSIAGSAAFGRSMAPAVPETQS